jgi:membrane associated rhomboid family serine protease
MEMLASRDTWWMAQAEAVLSAEGIPSRWVSPWEKSANGALLLDVPASEAVRACELLSEQLGDELVTRQQATAPRAWVPLLLQPDFAFALCLALLLVAFFVVSGGTAAGSVLFRRGALDTSSFHAGEWWRLVTAATLHADLEHIGSNAVFLLLLAWAASERFGAGVTLGLFVLTAMAGFVVSLVFSDATLTVGASGGLFGLLGASGGHGFRARRDVAFPWRERLRVGGAAVLLLAFTAFSPEANIPAHLGGFVAGLIGGLFGPVGRRPGTAWQVAGAAVGIGLVAAAWASALTAVPGRH